MSLVLVSLDISPSTKAQVFCVLLILSALELIRGKSVDGRRLTHDNGQETALV